MKTQKTLNEIEQTYELELPKIVETIKKEKAKKVLLQFPDGLKPYSTSILDELKKLTKNKVEFVIWLDTCFGACDIPIETEKLGIDLIVQFGHSAWNYSSRKDIKVVK
jgi:2-(3-amino-3-carboxypropyl)histidine synthase